MVTEERAAEDPEGGGEGQQQEGKYVYCIIESENRQEKEQKRKDCQQIVVGQFRSAACHIVLVNLLPDIFNQL